MTELFCERNVRLVLRTLLRLGAPQGEVEDLAQEVFVIVHRRAGDFDPARRVEPWLYGICRNIMRDHWRKRGAHREQLGDGEDVAGSESLVIPVEAPSHEQVSVLRQAIGQLSEPLLDVLMLRDMLGMTLPETAEELQIPLDTAKDRLRRARDTVRAKVQRLELEVARG